MDNNDADFERWCKDGGVVIPTYDVVWESGPNTFAVRHVKSGQLIVSTDYANASQLAEKWNTKTGDL